MKTVIVVIEQNPTQITGCPTNFTIKEKDHGKDGPVGHGSTLSDAIQDFKSSWELKYDDELEVMEFINGPIIK